MSIDFEKPIDPCKIKRYATERLAEIAEHIFIHEALIPVLEKWQGKCPNQRLIGEAKEALNGGRVLDEGPRIQYRVFGLKSYSMQQLTIQGRNTNSDDPETIRELGARSRVRHGYNVIIHLGHLDGNKYVPIKAEHVERNEHDAVTANGEYNKLVRWINPADSGDADSQMWHDVELWNMNLKALQEAQAAISSRAGYCRHLFDIGIERHRYDIHKD